mmetsp:Transcript_39820/g.94428  ORF Transcript_39820/g.94428 Transcript_39820/m.94428 type:complete len:227 (+) Transcript_39820:282-962(+)
MGGGPEKAGAIGRLQEQHQQGFSEGRGAEGPQGTQHLQQSDRRPSSGDRRHGVTRAAQRGVEPAESLPAPPQAAGAQAPRAVLEQGLDTSGAGRHAGPRGAPTLQKPHRRTPGPLTAAGADVNFSGEQQPHGDPRIHQVLPGAAGARGGLEPNHSPAGRPLAPAEPLQGGAAVEQSVGDPRGDLELRGARNPRFGGQLRVSPRPSGVEAAEPDQPVRARQQAHRDP